MDQETYSNAPITEAVLDIRVRLADDFDYKALKSLAQSAPAYPTQRQSIQFKLQWTKHQGQAIVENHDEQELGYVFVSKDDLQLFQARKDGFSHNRLAPYQSWSQFKNEAKHLWGIYKAATNPKAIELLGLTYINKLDLPMGAKIEDYVSMFVNVPDGMPQIVEQYSMSIQLSNANEANQLTAPRASVSQSLTAPTSDATVSMMVTIRAFEPIISENDRISDEEVWTRFDGLREMKNNIFEGLITDRIREAIR